MTMATRKSTARATLNEPVGDETDECPTLRMLDRLHVRAKDRRVRSPGSPNCASVPIGIREHGTADHYRQSHRDHGQVDAAHPDGGQGHDNADDDGDENSDR